MYLDNLIDLAVSSAEIEAGIAAEIVQNRSALPVACLACESAPAAAKSPEWTERENAFLAKQLGRMEEADIARDLGRTQNSIHLRWSRDLRLPAPSKHPDYLTANRIALLIGKDGHVVCSWIDRGLLAGEILPGGRRIRRVSKAVLLEWLLDPRNWMLFDPRAVCDPRLRQLLDHKLEQWGDEWWTTRQLADYHGVDPSDVKRYIKCGWIKAIRVPNLGGRTAHPYWARWFVLRSEATRSDLVFRRLKRK
jgi:hypothetical protein